MTEPHQIFQRQKRGVYSVLRAAQVSVMKHRPIPSGSRAREVDQVQQRVSECSNRIGMHLADIPEEMGQVFEVAVDGDNQQGIAIGEVTVDGVVRDGRTSSDFTQSYRLRATFVEQLFGSGDQKLSRRTGLRHEHKSKYGGREQRSQGPSPA